MAITIVWSGRGEYKNIRADIRFKKIVYALFFVGNFPVFPEKLFAIFCHPFTGAGYDDSRID
jgi:hypothetical protein